jgi:hypothetical protein
MGKMGLFEGKSKGFGKTGKMGPLKANPKVLFEASGKREKWAL